MLLFRKENQSKVVKGNCSISYSHQWIYSEEELAIVTNVIITGKMMNIVTEVGRSEVYCTDADFTKTYKNIIHF